MNILVDALPEAVEIDGEEYAINTDFRTALRVIMAFEDDDLTVYEKQIVMLQNLYPLVPDNGREAVRLANKYLNGGKAEDGEDREPGYRLYSFAKDAELIFAAFRQTHGIDLGTEKMHWWKFLALFMDLGAETTFCNLIALRKRVKSGKATKEELSAAREMGELFDIPEPDTRTVEEKEREALFLKLVEDGEKKRAKAKETEV